MSAVLVSLLDVVQLAHETQFQHEEPMKSGGASAIVILAGVLVSLLAVGGLIWLKRRVND